MTSQSSSRPEKTEPLPPPTHNRPSDSPQLSAAYAQSIGKQRDHNEDALLMLSTSLATDSGNTFFGLYIVADGMGGHNHGELASQLAIKTLSSHVTRHLLLPLLHPKGAAPEETIQEILHDGVFEAHKAIVKDVYGGGTTLTAALILGDQLTIVHVGDSRAYALTGGAIEPLTRDHSLVARLEELGQITAEEASVHPQRNVLYRALGQGEPFEADLSIHALPRPGHLLLCSDGLWGVVPETQILNVIQQTTDLQAASQRLIDLANDAGGPDNITAILVRTPSSDME